MIVAGCFLLLVLIPCIVAFYSSSKEGPSGNSGEHDVAQAPTAARGHTPSRIQAAAVAMEARKEAKVAAEVAAKADRPSRIRLAAAAFTRPLDDLPVDQRPSRIRLAAAALIAREPKKHVPMVAGDPGAPKQSIRDLRAKHAAAAKTTRS